MTEVIKNIRGINHRYYQDTIKGRNKSSRKVVTTLISRVDVPQDKFIQKKHEALVKHFSKIEYNSKSNIRSRDRRLSF